MHSEAQERMVTELMEILRKRRNLRDSGGPVSTPHDDNVYDILEKILNSAKQDKPDTYTVDWTFLEALLVKFREEEACIHGLRVGDAKLHESKQMDFADVKLRLPCRFSHGEDYPPPSVVPWYLRPLRPTSQHQRKWWEGNPNFAVSSIKYRKGACENCGAMTHGSNSCMERYLKRGPKLTYKPYVFPDTKMASIRINEDLISKLLNNDPETQSKPEDPLPHADSNDHCYGDNNQDRGS
ncbi:uncharacterized protein LOC107430064 [Ziziphus jujuba]|uniref:Pre-mRNA-splicing factor SLU7 n=1 Tax=Ziziphus jujuba TaxID=326968 RepID=A0A6P4BBD8_ZIZJJ|nr:uncharacterized protein LOC107430064 [Ziziphus jujuba]